MGSRGLFKLSWGARQPVETTDVERKSDERTQRIKILSAELDVLRAAAFERTRTIETKASYIVVVAGVLASVTGVSLVTTDTWLIGLLPFGFMIAAVIVATIASRPRKLGLPSARQVVDTWVDADIPAVELEDNILEVKAKEITKRDESNEKRANITNWGFSLLLGGLVTTLIVVILNALSPNWSSDDEAELTQTAICTEAASAP